MALFSEKQLTEINKVAVKCKEPKPVSKSSKNIQDNINSMMDSVLEYFKDSNSLLITTEDQLVEYVDKCIEYGYAGIDTETTGLDRIKDYIVGASLYVPGMPDCYIPMKHRIPLFEQPYKDQLSYEQVSTQFNRLKNCKLIFANADFDLSMIWKDLHVDFNQACYYDVIIAWRCLKENEPKNDLKTLYNKYVNKGKGDPKKFSDFFTLALFPYCKPQVAALYAGNDAKITFELFKWQIKYLTKTSQYCTKKHLERISDLVWNIEFPLIEICQNMFRSGIYVDKDVTVSLDKRYNDKYKEEKSKLASLVQDELDKITISPFTKHPFTSGLDFNPESPTQVKYLLYDVMKIPKVDGQGTGKEILADLNLDVTNQILKVRSLGVLINTFVKKLPQATTSDSRIHAQFKQLGAETGRLSSRDPNLMNIPSRAVDIRHMFRATPSSKELINAEETDGKLRFKLHRCSHVDSDKGKVVVKDLSIGDILPIKDSSSDCKFAIDDILVIEESPYIELIGTVEHVERI